MKEEVGEALFIKGCSAIISSSPGSEKIVLELLLQISIAAAIVLKKVQRKIKLPSV